MTIDGKGPAGVWQRFTPGGKGQPSGPSIASVTIKADGTIKINYATQPAEKVKASVSGAK